MSLYWRRHFRTCVEGDVGTVGEREVVVPGRDAAPLPEEVEGLLDGSPGQRPPVLEDAAVQPEPALRGQNGVGRGH